jgi:membrane protease subunit HflK
MPWKSQGGGGPGGGGPWGGGPGGGGPWGGGAGPGGQRPPDFEDFIRKGQDRFKRMLPAGMGSGWGLFAIIVAVLLAWAALGLYRVQPDQQGIELVFGRWDEAMTEPGLRWNYPYPVGSVETPSVTSIQQIEIGFRSSGERGRGGKRNVDEESLMLTGDQNIIDIEFTVQWKIADAGRYLFNIRDPESTVKVVAESTMREIIGQTDIQLALTEARQEIELRTRELLQRTLTGYEAGIEITEVQLQEVLPPAQVIDAFDDVQRARQDLDRLRNEAEAYRNDILPRARGEAVRQVQEAEAYKERLENEADGEAQRFLSVFAAYKQNPEVTRRRMFLETLQDVLSRTDKVIMDPSVQGVVPYLPLDQLRRRTAPGN